MTPAPGVVAYFLEPPPPALSSAVADVLHFSEAHMPRLRQVLYGVSSLADTFNNTFSFTATRTWKLWNGTGTPDGTVFIDTGDIQQQWLRDSCNQMRPYLPLAKVSCMKRRGSPAVSGISVYVCQSSSLLRDGTFTDVRTAQSSSSLTPISCRT